MSPKQQAALAMFAPAAVAAERASSARLGVGYPAEVTIAQWGAETGWSIEGVTGAWNLFGLTAATCPARPKKFCPTSEEMTLAQFVKLPMDERESVTGRSDLGHGVYRYSLSRWFACFDSLANGVSAYVGVITAPGHRYYVPWMKYTQDNNIDRLIEGIAGAGYASGRGYADLLKSIAHQEAVRTQTTAQISQEDALRLMNSLLQQRLLQATICASVGLQSSCNLDFNTGSASGLPAIQPKR